MLFAECTRLEQCQGGQFQGGSLSLLAQQKSKEVSERATIFMWHMILGEPSE